MSLDGQAKLSAHLRIVADSLGEVLDELSGEHVIFALHIFGEGRDGRGQYVSNGERSDIRKALRELLDHWDKNEGRDDGPYHVFRKAN